MLEQRLSQLNPWWSDPSKSWVSEPSIPRRREFHELFRLITSTAPLRPVFLVGLRRIGKTTLAKQVLLAAATHYGLSRSCVTIADLQELALDGMGPEEVIEAALARMAPDSLHLVLLDEIQFVPHWPGRMKAMVTRFAGRNLRVIVTGSGTASIRRGLGDELLDRADLVPMGPLTFLERVELEHPDASRSSAELNVLLDQFFVVGGFPGLFPQHGPYVTAARLRETAERYVIDGDLGRRLKIRHQATFGKCWMHFAENPGATQDWAKLCSEFGVSRPTLEGWMKHLCDAELLVELEPSDTAGRPLRGRKRPSKMYPIDHALANAYGVPSNEGPGLETLVFRQLRSIGERLRRSGEPCDLTYWVDRKRKGRNEVDFRLTGKRTRLLVEVKTTRAPAHQEIAALGAMAGELGVARALFVCRTNEPSVRELGHGSAVTVLPLVEFLLRADRVTDSCEVLFS